MECVANHVSRRGGEAQCAVRFDGGLEASEDVCVVESMIGEVGCGLGCGENVEEN